MLSPKKPFNSLEPTTNLSSCVLRFFELFPDFNDLSLHQKKNSLSGEPYLSDIKRVNTIIGKVAPSFQNILDRLSKNNNLKEIQYDLILQKLIDNSIEQHLE